MSTTEKQRRAAILKKLCELRDTETLPNGFYSNLAKRYSEHASVQLLPNNMFRWLRLAKARSDTGNPLTVKDIFLINASNELLQKAAEEAKKLAKEWEK